MICLLQPVNKKDDGAGSAVDSPKSDETKSSNDLPDAGEVTREDHHIMGQLKQSPQDEKKAVACYADDVEVPLQTIADCGKHLDYFEKSRLRVGIIINTTQTSHRALLCLANPASSCRVTALAVLHPPSSFSCADLNDSEEDGHLTPGSIMRQWMNYNNLGNHSESVAVLGGEEGAKQIVQRDDVDAVFIIVPDE
jgi:hypothetical protein